MAKKTMEKNSLLKFFEIFKDNFFQIVMLGSILSFIAVVLTMASFGLSALLVHLFGQKAIFNYLTFCPFILIFPFVTAVLKIFRNYVREVPVLLWPDLKQAFTQNFGQSLILGVLSYLSIVLVFISYNYYSIATIQSPESTFAQLGVGVCTVFALMIVYITSYSMMMIVTLDLKLNKILKNALIFCYLSLPRNLIMTVSLAIWLGICAILIYFAAVSGYAIIGGIVLMLLLLFIFSITLYIIAFFTFPPIKKHILDPYYKSHPEETSEQIESSIQSDELEDDDKSANEDKNLPEYVYHNGRMVHRSIFEKEKLVDDELDD